VNVIRVMTVIDVFNVMKYHLITYTLLTLVSPASHEAMH
jgi:hypothetical protein